MYVYRHTHMYINALPPRCTPSKRQTGLPRSRTFRTTFDSRGVVDEGRERTGGGLDAKGPAGIMTAPVAELFSSDAHGEHSARDTEGNQTDVAGKRLTDERKGGIGQGLRR